MCIGAVPGTPSPSMLPMPRPQSGPSIDLRHVYGGMDGRGLQAPRRVIIRENYREQQQQQSYRWFLPLPRTYDLLRARNHIFDTFRESMRSPTTFGAAIIFLTSADDIRMQRGRPLAWAERRSEGPRLLMASYDGSAIAHQPWSTACDTRSIPRQSVRMNTVGKSTRRQNIKPRTHPSNRSVTVMLFRSRLHGPVLNFRLLLCC